jgi:hypothetical protein
MNVESIEGKVRGRMMFAAVLNLKVFVIKSAVAGPS